MRGNPSLPDQNDLLGGPGSSDRVDSTTKGRISRQKTAETTAIEAICARRISIVKLNDRVVSSKGGVECYDESEKSKFVRHDAILILLSESMQEGNV